MTRRKSPFAAHAVLMSLVIDAALAGGAPRPVTRVPTRSNAPTTSFSAECAADLDEGRTPTTSVADSLLWPPYHQFIDVGYRLALTAACEGWVTVTLSIWSDEPDEDETGDGDAPADAQIDPPSLFLRAERKGDSDGRVYLAITTATLPDGTTGTACTTVLVPHAQNPPALASVRAQGAAAEAYCNAQGTAPPDFVELDDEVLTTANAPPVVNAGPDQAIDFGTPASLDGTVTDDGRPGQALTALWSQVSGPGTVVFAAPGHEDTTATFSAPGTYVLRLTGDDSQHSTSDDVTVVVSVANTAPVVDAGADQDVILPVASVTLAGTATDDGRPTATLITTWTSVDPTAPVQFADPGALATVVTFGAAGTYYLRLTADDTQFQVSDTVEVTVHAEPPPILDMTDVQVAEGQEGVTGAAVAVTLSRAWSQPVTVDYMTADGTATAGCDYGAAFGTVTFAPGETTRHVMVPAIGELVAEPSESLFVRWGNVSQAVLARTQSSVTIQNDDDANQPPVLSPTRAPADGADGLTLPVTLAWSATDPDVGDTLTHDIFLGTSFSTGGQSWAASCAASAAQPPARHAAVTAYDEDNDRLIVFGGQTAGGGADATLWILSNASQTGGPPDWTAMATAEGPTGLRRAVAAFDSATNRMFVHGGCSGECAAASDETWVLSNANGLGGTPMWSRLSIAGPPARLDHAATFDASGRRMVVFGGSSSPEGTAFGDVWVLSGLGIGESPAWSQLQPAGAMPEARAGASLVFDPRAARALLFGGRGASGALADVWSLTLTGTPEWVQLVTGQAGGPVGRLGHAAIYEPVSRRMLVWGGSTAAPDPAGRFMFGDAWLLETAGAQPVWVPLTPGRTPPTGRVHASAGYSQTANRLIVFGGLTKSDGDAADAWVLTDAAGALPLISGAQEPSTLTVPDLVPGDAYYWRTVTRDSRGAWRGSTAARFTSNTRPLVEAGPDATITLPADSVSLAGTVVDDGLPAPGELTTAWTVASGPASVTFTDAASPVTTATFAANGTYVLRLTASDSMLAASDELTVVVRPPAPPNQPPAAHAGPDQTIGLVPAPRRGWVVVNNDEWTTSDPGFSQAPTVAQFVRNMAALFADGQPGTFLAYSNNFAYTGTSLRNTLQAAGHTYTISTSVPFTLPTLLQYDGVFLAGNAVPNAVLIDYVNAGGSVYLCGGTGIGAGTEAALWSVFLNAFGMRYEPVYTNVGPPVAVSSSHPLLAGVTSLYYNGGNSITLLTPGDPKLHMLHQSGSTGLLALYDGNPGDTGTAVVTLNGTVTDDGFPEGSVLSSSWTRVSGPSPVTFADPTAVATTATLDRAGVYLLRLTGSDGDLTGDDDVVVTVVPGNQRPYVDAGPDQTLTLPTLTSTLQGTVYDDGLPAGGGLTVEWSVVSGPGSVVFSNPASLISGVTFGAVGAYELRITATDTDLAATDTVTVRVEGPDLALQSLDVAGVTYDGQTLSVGGTASASIFNGGSTAAAFTVSFFEDRNGNGTYEAADDALLGATVLGSLGAGATTVASAPLSGSVLFPGNIIHVLADSADVVAESNETNNSASSAPPCVAPPPAPFAPVLEWSWQSTTADPTSTSVIMTPAVADLDGDGAPEVIFVTSMPDYAHTAVGRLRAVSGRDGHEVFSITEPALGLHPVSQIAVGDIDGDGRPEIVASAHSRLMAFEHDGTFKWASPGLIEGVSLGGPALADLDGDGSPEILIGRQALNADGSIRWTGQASLAPTWGRLPVVADLDLDGVPEVVAGNIAYRANGATYWSGAFSGSLNAIADFDSDPNPEIVAVGGGEVRLLEHDGVVKWSVLLPGGGEGGAPTVADLDGDGEPEIGVAGSNRYTTFRGDGSVKWSVVIRDFSSHVTGSSVFDFDGDGSVEVVYRDELQLRIYRGATGEVLFETPLNSCTGYENPVVADIDADGNAELLSTADRHCGFAPLAGIFVYGDANDRWVMTRRVWNQHTYHVTNVNDDLTIPAHEADNWATFNNYRQNRLTAGCEFAQPDLIAAHVSTEVGAQVILTARIGNAGSALAPAGVRHGFHDGEPGAGGTLLGVATTGSLLPGQFEDVTLTLPAGVFARPLWVVADEAGTQTESDETNNRYNSHLFVLPAPNQPPVVDAGPDQETGLPAPTITLVGTATDDGLPFPTLAVRWDVVSGPGSVTFGTPLALQTTAAFTVAGAYTLSLSANDGLAENHDTVLVVVHPLRPDLKVGGVDTTDRLVDGQSLAMTGSVSVAIENVGAAATAGEFEVTAFADRDGNGEYDPAQDVPLGSGTSAALADGATAMLTIAVAGTALYAGEFVSAMVDSAASVSETNEGNNVGSSRPAVGRADLIPSFVRTADESGATRVTARIANAGATAAPSGVSVAFYSRDPRATGTLLGTAAVSSALTSGGFADVSILLPEAARALPLWVVADDVGTGTGTVDEEDEANNFHNSRIFLSDQPNAPPVVSAGPDQRLPYPAASTILAATVSDDGLPQATLTVSWSRTSGPGAVVFATPNSANTLVTFGAPGVYSLRLEADDAEIRVSDSVVVVVEGPNQAPAVSAGPDRAITTQSTAIQGTASDDGLPFGSAVAVSWSRVSGPGSVTFVPSGSPQPTVSFDQPGTYVLRVSATDSLLTRADEVEIVVTFVNRAPVVNAGPDQAITLPASTVTLAGAGTDDGIPAGAVLAYSWSQVAGPSTAFFDAPLSPSSTVTFGGPGSYVLRLTVSDGVLAGSDDVAVLVGGTPPSGLPPTASLTSPAAGIAVTQPTMVRGSVASDTLASWRLEHRLSGTPAWTRFGFGTTAVTDADLATFDPTLLLNGLYDIRLVATDTAGRAAAATTQLVVKDNFKVGHFTVSFVDLEVPVAGIPIQVGRTYDSRDKRLGDFGYGWRLDVSNVRVEETGTAGLGWIGTTSFGFFPTYCLQEQSPKVVTVTLPNGRVYEFDAIVTPSCRTFAPPQEVSVTYRPRAGTHGTLVPVEGNVAAVAGGWPAPGGSAQMQLFGIHDYTLFDPSGYRLTLPDGRAFVISQSEGLQRITDLDNNVLTVTRNGITHSSGRGVAFVRHPATGVITSVVDPDANAITYGYSPAGDLESVTDRETNATRFGYHPVIAHHLESIRDPLGRTPIRNEYDPATGRLVRHVDAFGKVIEYTHLIGSRQEIVKDRNGKQRVLDYDERGNVLRETDPMGKVVLRTYDLRNNRLTETIPHAPLPPGAPAAPTTVYEYFPSDDLKSVTDADGNRTEYTYTTRGQVKTVKDARALAGGYVSTENEYDPLKGNLLWTRDAEGTRTDYVYWPDGNVRTLTVKDVNGVVLSTTAYDYEGGLLTRERSLSSTGVELRKTEYVNGIHGVTSRKTWRTTPTGIEQLVTTYEYDLNGRLKKTIDPDLTVTRTEYDATGQQWKSYDKLGRVTESHYDDMGRLWKTTNPDGTTEESTFDNEGRRLTSRDRRGRITRYEYDDLGRLVKTFPPADPVDSVVIENRYDDAGRLERTIDARGKATRYEYWDSGRRKKVIDPLNNETYFEYDPSGNQKLVRDPKAYVTTFEYDRANRRTKTFFPDVPQTYAQTTYDGLGRRISERDQAGRVTHFRYDGLGQLKEVEDARGKVTKYEYDEVGNRTRQIDAKSRETRFEYDTLGRETKRVLPGGAYETKEYWPDGNLKTRVDFMGRRTTYVYDPLTGRLMSRGYPDLVPAPATVAFTYWDDGRRKTAEDGRGVTHYDYDLRGRLKTLVYPDGRAVGYSHDGNGNRTSVTATGVSASPIVTSYTYDDAGRLDHVIDPLGRVHDHGYDPNGNRQTLEHPNGAVTTYTYNTLNRLTDLATVRQNTTIQSYAFTLGPAGNREVITEGDGTVRTYSYDELYRLTGDRVNFNGPTGPLHYEKVFTYDDVGNRETQTTTGTGAPGTPTAPGLIDYGYDDRDRLMTETGVVGGYTYDENGNVLTRAGDTEYAWDIENRLVRVARTGGPVVEHVYDVDGTRVRTTLTPVSGPAVVTDFLVDTSGSLSHVMAETDGAGALRAYYVRGDDLLAVMRPGAPGAWSTNFVHADGIGSIRRLTDEAGTITDGYTYTAFGELIAHTGTDPQPYAFAGEPFDPNSGFQYHRARWMDPSAGRFLGMDPFGGRSSDPITLHRYLYGNASPISVVDPSGREGLASMLTGISISNVIRSMATGFAVGAVIGVTDSYLSGDDPDEMEAAAFQAGLIGGVTGGLSTIRYAAPVLLVAGEILAAVGVAEALQDDNYALAGFRSTLFLAGTVAFFRSIEVTAPRPGGRLGNPRTRAHIAAVADGLEQRGFTIVGGGGRAPEIYIPGPGPGTRGSNWIDITAEKNGRRIHINTVDTYADGVRPTRRESAAAALIRSKRPNEHLVLIPKPK